jgi:hypothetical protein
MESFMPSFLHLMITVGRNIVEEDLTIFEVFLAGRIPGFGL